MKANQLKTGKIIEFIENPMTGQKRHPLGFELYKPYEIEKIENRIIYLKGDKYITFNELETSIFKVT